MTEQMNGPAEGSKYIDTIDPDDPQYQREMMRPAEVKEDVKQMESRKRVSLILNSQAFREELEDMISQQLQSGPHPASLLALQQIADLIMPQNRFNQTSGSFSKVSGSVSPVADIRGVDSLNYGKGEKILRCKVASTYRLIDIFGWSSGFSSSVTARISQDLEHFLVAPYGLFYHEVTAASLLKIDMQGDILDSGNTTLTLNKAGYTLHSAIHAARPDIKAIIHIQSPAAVSMSMLKTGLLPISREALLCGEVSRYDFQGIVDQDERDRLIRALGPSNKIMFLRNNGVLACGESIEEAFYFAFNVMLACDTQLRMMPLGVENISVIPEENRQSIVDQVNSFYHHEEEGKRKWRRGEMEFEALMRSLDNAGYRTGYVYHEPLLRRDKKDRVNSEVEVPPTSSSFSYVFDDERSKYQSPIKQMMEYQKKQFKSEWLNTPNAYKREEFEETGTPNPKKITRWVADGSPAKTSTPLKVENPNQFVPITDNPKEFRSKQREIREAYYTEKGGAGPQSKILEGMTWEEAQRLKEGHISGTQDPLIVMGAASKGIIQRDHQHNANVYKQYYAPNPFDNMTEEDIEKYKQEIEGRGQEGQVAAGDAREEVLEPGPEGRLISTEERMVHIRQGTMSGPGDQVEAQKVHGRPAVQETSIDDVPPTEPPPQEFQRTQSARYSGPPRSPDMVKELEQNFERSKSERYPKGTRRAVNGDEAQAAGSPTKSTSSGADTMEERSSKEGSPTKEVPPEQASPSKGEKKKKKKFRIPSFSKKKDKRESNV